MSGRPRIPEADRARIMGEVNRRLAESETSRTIILDDLGRVYGRSSRSLRRWLSKQLGMDLSDGRARNGRRSRLEQEPELRQALLGYLLRHKNLKASQACKLLITQFPEHHRRRRFTPSTCRAWLDQLRRRHSYFLALHYDPDGHRSKYGVAFGRADETVTRLNQVWELDATKTDLFLRGPNGQLRRYVVMAVIDVFSRRAMVLIAETSCAATVAALIRLAIIAWGVPEKVRTDGGADFVSHHVARLLADLGIAHDVCDPFSPQQKGFIESFLKTLSRWFELRPGYCGHSVGERQGLRNRQSFAERYGQGDRASIEMALTLEELQPSVAAWCEDEYGRRVHSGIGMSPFEKAAAWKGSVRRIENERALDILIFEPVGGGSRRVVSKKGIAADGGLYLPETFVAPGTAVHVFRDAADRGRVLIKGEDGGFLTWAVCPERLGENRVEYARRMKIQERIFKAELRREGKRLMTAANTDTLVDQMAANAKAEADKVIAFPHPAELHETPALAEAAKAAAARPAPARARPTKDKAIVNDAWDRLIARRAERKLPHG